MPTQVWILAIAAIIGIIGLAVLVLRRSGGPSSNKPADLPSEWPLTQRPIFSPEERALYRQLRAALPHHTILAKLPLVRFCQPEDREELRYWFNLLGPIHVSFVVCAENGRVLAAVDIERPNQAPVKRVAAIKIAVLEACRVRYVRCRSDQLPTTAELQLLVPASGDGHRPVVPGSLNETAKTQAAAANAASLAHSVHGKQASASSAKTHLSPKGQGSDSGQHNSHGGNGQGTAAASNDGAGGWYESGFSQDSFFAPETQRDPFDDTQSPTPATHAAPARSWAGAHTAKFNPADFGPSGNAGGDIIGRR